MKNKSNCPTNYALELFGDKWSLLIIRDLMFKGKRHYNEFLDAEEKVSTSVLHERLKSLVKGGLITKHRDNIKKSRIRYSLSEKGIAMLPMMIDIILWSAKFDQYTAAEKNFIKDATDDRDNLLIEIEKNLISQHLNQ